MATKIPSPYPLPNAVGESAQETARLDAHQELWILELGSLSLAPLTSEIKLAVDLGCGTGIWARTMAAKYPATKFIGIDVNPPLEGQLETGTGNCQFVKANVEQDWKFLDAPGTVDYTLARMLTTGMRDWQSLYDRAFAATKPGGYFESQETAIGLFSDDNEEARQSPLMTWFNLLADFSAKNGVETRSVDLHGKRLEQAGFKLVEEKPFVWYFDASRPEMKGKERVSHIVTEQINDFLDNVTPRIFAKSDTMTLEEGMKLAAAAKIDLRERSGQYGLHTRYCVRVGQKPA